MESPNPTGDSALHVAVRQGQIEHVRTILIQQQIDVNILNSKCETPLHLACSQGDSASVQLLIIFGADPYIKDSNNKTAHHRGSSDVATLMNNLLYYHGLWISAPTESDCDTLLHTVVRQGNTDKLILQRMTEKQVIDPLCIDDDGNTPLHIAAINNWEDIVRLFITKYKCPVNCTNKFGQTPLHLAITKDYLNLCTTLLSEFSADANALDKKHETPLNVAINSGNAKAVHILAVEFGCKPYVRGAESKPLLHQLCAGGHSTMLQDLIVLIPCTHLC